MEWNEDFTSTLNCEDESSRSPVRLLRVVVANGLELVPFTRSHCFVAETQREQDSHATLNAHSTARRDSPAGHPARTLDVEQLLVLLRPHQPVPVLPRGSGLHPDRPLVHRLPQEHLRRRRLKGQVGVGRTLDGRDGWRGGGRRAGRGSNPCRGLLLLVEAARVGGEQEEVLSAPREAAEQAEREAQDGAVHGCR